jgi:4'-phosphopantetheinyl transferase
MTIYRGVLVFFVKVPPDDERIDLLLDRLDQADHLRAARLQTLADRRVFIIAHALRRFALTEATGRPTVTLAIGRFGKPRLTGLARWLGPWFNLSYRPGMAACAVSTAGPVGLDVERFDATAAESTMMDWFTADEQATLAALTGQDRVEAFFRLWTAKEAIAKATGRGLAGPPPPSVSASWRIERRQLSESHIAALAIRRRRHPPAVEWRRMEAAAL